METIKVSVVIPVYNAAPYLEQCLSSVIDQSLKEIEIICVDDGSTDCSVQIIENFMTKDDRITLLHQDHKYAGEARNKGMDAATGKYLMFWDADDYLYPKALELMYEQCENDNADICICGGRQFFDQKGFEAPAPRYLRKNEIPDIIPFNGKSAPDHVTSITVEATWNKLFKTEFIRREKIRFNDALIAEDVSFTQPALCLAERITVVNKQLICYRKDKKTGLVSIMSEGLMSALKTWVETADYIRSRDAFPERSFANRAFESVIYLLNNAWDWEAFREGFLYLQDGNLEKLGILEREDPDYYYIKYQNEAVSHFYHDTPEQYLKWIETLLYFKEAEATGRQRSNDEKHKKTIKSNEKKIETLNNDNNRMKDEIKELKEENNRLNQKNRKLTDKSNKLEKELNTARNNINKIKNSKAYKVGNAIAWLPRKIRDL